MHTSSSSGSPSALNLTASSSRRLSGLMSGLDTDALVKQLSMGTQKKIDKLMQNKQLAAWRQTSYREVTSALQEFQDKYFSTSSSSSNLSMRAFFQSSTINNTSSALNISGNSTNASNMVITQIKQLAVQASFSSSYKVSNQTVTSLSEVKDVYTRSALSGASITVNYAGKDYAVTLDGDFNLDDSALAGGVSDAERIDYLQKVTEALNKKINANSDISGKLEFSVFNGKVKLNKSDLSSNTFYIESGSSSLLSGLGLKADDKKTGVSTLLGNDTNVRSFFNDSISSGSSLDFSIGGKSYTLEIPSSISLYTSDSTDSALQDSLKAENQRILQQSLDDAIKNNVELKGKLSVNVDSALKITFSSSAGAVNVTGGTQNVLKGFGLDSGAGAYSATGTVNGDELVKTYMQDTLAGATITFDLNGLAKRVTFDESDKSAYATSEGMASYLQGKLNNVFGAGNVAVSINAGKLSFKALNATSTFTVVSSDTSGLLGSDGLLHTYAGESNRINANKTLKDLAGNLSSTLTSNSDGSFGLTINGKDFAFKATDTLATVISTINNDNDANVTVAYSSTLDSFSITADNGGEGSKVDISTLGGSNLATVLFGKKADTQSSLTFDFNGRTVNDGDTITIDGTIYEFDTNGSTGSGNTAVTIPDGASADDIASAFKNIGLSGYAGSSSGGIVTFTANTAGYQNEPVVSGIVNGNYRNGSSSSLEYDFTGKTGTDLLGKTIIIGNKTYEFATSDKLIGGVTKNGNIGIAIGDGSEDSASITADQITSAFSSAIGSVSGYSTGVNGNRVILQNNGAVNYSVTAGKNAELMMSFDGNPDNATLISRTENKFTVDEVNFELLKADTTVTKDKPITFTVKNETDDLYKKVTGFIDDYNALLKVINDKVNESKKTEGQTYAPLTDDQKATMTADQIAKWDSYAKKGILQSDSLLTTVSYDMRNAMFNMVDSVKDALYSVGITEVDYDKYGKLTIDETKFKGALTNNPDLVASLFTGKDGIASRLKTIITKNTNTSIGADGLLVQKAGISSRDYDTSVIGRQITDYNSRIKDLKTQLETEQDRYYRKFTALESYLSVMNAQSSLFFNNTSSS